MLLKIGLFFFIMLILLSFLKNTLNFLTKYKTIDKKNNITLVQCKFCKLYYAQNDNKKHNCF